MEIAGRPLALMALTLPALRQLTLFGSWLLTTAVLVPHRGRFGQTRLLLEELVKEVEVWVSTMGAGLHQIRPTQRID